jgi:zinc transport system substrate-binding protein
MKRIIIILCFFAAVISYANAGGKQNKQVADNGKINVVTTIFPPYDFVREIAGDKVNVTMLLPPGSESHSFEPSPRDIITVQNCDIFIYVGGESEEWVNRILNSMDTSNMKIIAMMDCVNVVEEEIVEGMEDDEEGHDHGHDSEPFTINDVKDRALSDWAGSWQSVYPLLLDGTLKPVMEHKAESGEKTANEYYNQYKTAYQTDVEKINISGDAITFYRNGVPSTARYAYKGTAVLPEDDGRLWVRYQFEALNNVKGAPKYVLFSDHKFAPGKSEHFHIYAGDAGFSVFMEDKNPANYPTYYPASLTKTEIAAEMIGHEEEPEYDEHVWTSPVNAKLIAGAIADALKQADAPNADAYDAGAKEYFAKLDALDASIRTLVAGGKRKTFIFGDRFPFRYFADEYGLSYFAAFPGCSTETECSAATIAFIVDKIRDEKIPAVFYIELSNEKIADTIREETGARKLLLHSFHNVSNRDFENGATYHSLMTANLANLRTALY